MERFGLRRLAGARPVVVCDVIDRRLDYVPGDPRLVRVRSDREGIRAAVTDVTCVRVADVVIELGSSGGARLDPGHAPVRMTVGPRWGSVGTGAQNLDCKRSGQELVGIQHRDAVR
jgi:hypothetical protein